MSLYEEFCRAFLLNPAKAMAALYWYLTRRRVRGRNLLRQISSQAPYVYKAWIGSVERLPDVRSKAPAIIAKWDYRPSFSFVMYIRDGMDAALLDQTIDALKSQCYESWELLLVTHDASIQAGCDRDRRIRRMMIDQQSEAAALNAGIAKIDGTFIVPLSPGTRPSPVALFRLAEALQGLEQVEQVTVLYGDQDEIDIDDRRTNPWFKPKWNREMFLAQDFVSEACAIRTSVARSVAPLGPDVADAAVYALALEASALAPEAILHVPFVLFHLPEAPGRGNGAARLRVVSRYLAPAGGSVREGPFGSLRVSWPLPADPPKVSIIVPTRDKIELLRACVESVLTHTTYPNYELLIVDNRSVEPSTRDYFEELRADRRIRVLPYEAEFNFSGLNNMAVQQAWGEYVCLLNNDTQVVSPDWLDEMMRYATREEVGAVGARLLYPDGTIQHAGVVIGIGNAAGHAHRTLPVDQPGYFARAHIAHYVSAVTAACLLVAKRKFEAVDGLDSEYLKVAFNDVDFCLKLERVGWRNVYVPHATLIHYESKSRGSDMLLQNLERYLRELAVLQTRWKTTTYEDPLHHPHLDRANETYVVRL